jgi:hypothetical protein
MVIPRRPFCPKHSKLQGMLVIVVSDQANNAMTDGLEFGLEAKGFSRRFQADLEAMKRESRNSRERQVYARPNSRNESLGIVLEQAVEEGVDEEKSRNAAGPGIPALLPCCW